jgi:hypothetical protein
VSIREESWRDIIAWKAEVEPRFTRLSAILMIKEVMTALAGTWDFGWTCGLIISAQLLFRLIWVRFYGVRLRG